MTDAAARTALAAVRVLLEDGNVSNYGHFTDVVTVFGRRHPAFDALFRIDTLDDTVVPLDTGRMWSGCMRREPRTTPYHDVLRELDHSRHIELLTEGTVVVTTVDGREPVGWMRLEPRTGYTNPRAVEYGLYETARERLGAAARLADAYGGTVPDRSILLEIP